MEYDYPYFKMKTLRPWERNDLSKVPPLLWRKVRIWTRICPGLFITPWKGKPIPTWINISLSATWARWNQIQIPCFSTSKSRFNSAQLTSLFEQPEGIRCCSLRCAKWGRPPLPTMAVLLSRWVGTLEWPWVCGCFVGSRQGCQQCPRLHITRMLRCFDIWGIWRRGGKMRGSKEGKKGGKCELPLPGNFCSI